MINPFHGSSKADLRDYEARLQPDLSPVPLPDRLGIGFSRTVPLPKHRA